LEGRKHIKLTPTGVDYGTKVPATVECLPKEHNATAMQYQYSQGILLTRTHWYYTVHTMGHIMAATYNPTTN